MASGPESSTLTNRQDFYRYVSAQLTPTAVILDDIKDKPTYGEMLETWQDGLNAAHQERQAYWASLGDTYEARMLAAEALRNVEVQDIEHQHAA